MRKTRLVTLAFLLSAISVFSQDSTGYLLHIPKPVIKTLGLYIAPEITYGKLCNENTFRHGISAMLLINNRFAIGGTFQGTSDRSFKPADLDPLRVNARSGGLKLEYNFFPAKILHFGVNMLVGGGSLTADSLVNTAFIYYDRDHNDNDGYRQVAGSNFFILKPGVQVELNLIKYVKFFAGANYGFAFDSNQTNSRLPADMMQGVSAFAGIKAGLFEYRIRKKEEK